MLSKVKYSLFLLIMCIVLYIFPESVSADETASGTLSSNITWSISGNVMTISGTGEMGDVKNQPYSSYSSTVTEIIINEGVSSVGEGAFLNFSALKNVQLPETLEIIDVNAFSYCYNLTYINIPDNVAYIGKNAFYATSFLSKLTDKYIVLGNGILYEYKGDDSEIIVPDGVKTISDRAFVSDTKITSVKIPDSVRIIGSGAFLGCSGLKYAVIPENVDFIGDNSFGYILNPAPEIYSDFTLYGFYDTQAQFYAENSGVDFHLMGDSDGNGQLTAYDALNVVQYVSQISEPDFEQKTASDMDMNDMLTSYDALLILQHIVGL
jgi:hypothetical protein